jgi:hypothetical protein
MVICGIDNDLRGFKRLFSFCPPFQFLSAKSRKTIDYSEIFTPCKVETVSSNKGRDYISNRVTILSSRKSTQNDIWFPIE